MQFMIAMVFTLSAAVSNGQGLNMTVGGSSTNLNYPTCKSMPRSLETWSLWTEGISGVYPYPASSAEKYKYKWELVIDGTVVETTEKSSSDYYYDPNGVFFPEIPWITWNRHPDGGTYQVKLKVQRKLFGFTINTWNFTSGTLFVNTPEYNSVCKCSGAPTYNSGSDNDDIEVKQFVNGEIFVIMKKSGRMLKINNYGGSGHNMFAIQPSGNSFVTVPGYNYLKGVQVFSSPITDVEYTNGYTLIGFENGKILKVAGTGGTGQNMFAVTETSSGFVTVPGYSYYKGSHKFQSEITDIEYINGYTFVTFKNGKMLKVIGSGGTGYNLFAIVETSSGFNGLSGYAYYKGDAKFSGYATEVSYHGGYTFFSFNNGKMLKIANVGGTGHNMFAVTETSGGFNGLSGYPYYKGDAKFSGSVTALDQIDGKLIIGFANGKMLKVNGVGGTGHNMFAVVETSGGFSGVSGYAYYSGHAKYAGYLTDMIDQGSYATFGFSNGKVMKVTGNGGTGANMFNASENSNGFYRTSYSYANYLSGSAAFNTFVSDLFWNGSQTILSFKNRKMLKVSYTGGSGYNMYAVGQNPVDFDPICGYNYWIGTQYLGGGSRSAEAEELADDLESNTTISVENSFKVEPNPAAANTNLHFELNDRTNITAEVYDLSGRLVTSLYQNASIEAGNHYLPWNTEELEPGVYLIKVTTTAGDHFTEKVVKQ